MKHSKDLIEMLNSEHFCAGTVKFWLSKNNTNELLQIKKWYVACSSNYINCTQMRKKAKLGEKEETSPILSNSNLIMRKENR